MAHLATISKALETLRLIADAARNGEFADNQQLSNCLSVVTDLLRNATDEVGDVLKPGMKETA